MPPKESPSGSRRGSGSGSGSRRRGSSAAATSRRSSSIAANASQQPSSDGTPSASASATATPTPVSQPRRVSATRQRQLLAAMQSRLFPNEASFVSLRQLALAGNGWDLTAAMAQHARVGAEILRVETIDATDGPRFSGSPTQITSDTDLFNAMQAAGYDRILFAATREERHRRLANAFVRRLNQGRDANDQIRPSAADTILILHLNRWDIEAALVDFKSHTAAMNFLQSEFGHMLPRLADAGDAQPGPVQERQDESFALMLSITGRSDHEAIKRLLQRNYWNVAKAVAEWMTTGVKHWTENLVFDKRTKRPAHRFDANLNRIDPPSEESTKPEDMGKDAADFGPVRETFTPDGKTNKKKAAPIRQDVKKRGGRPFGFIIDEDRTPIEPGPDASQKFFVEYIKCGKYYWNRFRHVAFKFPELQVIENEEADFGPFDDESDEEGAEADRHGGKGKKAEKKSILDAENPVDFDFSDEVHLDRLRRNRAENFLRATGILDRLPSQPWQPEELDFLYDLYQHRLGELKNHPENVGTSEDDLLPMNYGGGLAERWADRFNEHFVGQRLGGSDFARFARKPAALITQASRTWKIVQRFKLKKPGWDFIVNTKSREARNAQKEADRLAKEADKKGTEEAIKAAYDAQEFADAAQDQVSEVIHAAQEASKEAEEAEKGGNFASKAGGKRKRGRDDGDDDAAAAKKSRREDETDSEEVEMEISDDEEDVAGLLSSPESITVANIPRPPRCASIDVQWDPSAEQWYELSRSSGKRFYYPRGG